jgi:glycosyltransferase involved in cell wall biosynthesis
MSQSRVSIVVPYYNAHAFLEQTLASALNQTCPEVEVIVVNDGSTDPDAVAYFEQLNDPRIRKFTTTNQGLPMARNTGISLASGTYILPLDADDLISSTYVEEAVKVLDAQPAVGIVYAHACFFGDVNAFWDLPAFDPTDFLTGNCIFACAMFRRADWLVAGGYKADMRQGLEDYDFWLSLVGLGRQVVRLPQVHFFYRKHGVSMISGMRQEQLHEAFKRILTRHRQLYADRTLDMIIRLNEYKREMLRLQQEVSELKAEKAALSQVESAA